MLLAALLACVGFVDDLGAPLSPVNQLLIATLILTIGCVLVPACMPNQLVAYFVSSSVRLKFGLVVFPVFVCVGFINEGNMNEGANGLFSASALPFLAVHGF